MADMDPEFENRIPIFERMSQKTGDILAYDSGGDPEWVLLTVKGFEEKFLCFAGSNCPGDILTDLKLSLIPMIVRKFRLLYSDEGFDGVLVHQGFQENLARAYYRIVLALLTSCKQSDTLVILGHSLGGSLAIMITDLLKQVAMLQQNESFEAFDKRKFRCITFGASAIFGYADKRNPSADALSIMDRAKETNINIVNTNDPVSVFTEAADSRYFTTPNIYLLNGSRESEDDKDIIAPITPDLFREENKRMREFIAQVAQGFCHRGKHQLNMANHRAAQYVQFFADVPWPPITSSELDEMISEPNSFLDEMLK
eukprot:216464_1